MSLKAYDVKELDLTNPRRFSLSAENELIDGKQVQYLHYNNNDRLTAFDPGQPG